MDGQSNVFTVVEYVSVFTAFIYGYVATRFFSGWGAMINFRHSIKFSKEHLFWTVLTFGLLIDIWWGSWIKGNFIHINHLYYISLLPPLLFYLVSVILFPPFSDDHFLDLKKYFSNVRRKHYLLFLGLFATFLINDYFFKRSFVNNFYLNFTAIVIALIAYFFHYSQIINRVVLVCAWCGLTFHMLNQPAIWQDNIAGFTMTEYLTIFIAFIYGSIASRILHGWGIMISKFNRITFNKDHLAWTILIFGLLLDFWTGSWRRESYIAINIYYFTLSLLVPVAFYALTAVLFPVMKSDSTIDFNLFYDSHKKMIYLLFAIMMIANTISANFMEQKLIDQENGFRLVALGLTGCAFFTKNIMVERIILVVGWLTLISHFVVDAHKFS
jgi:hypothetical protein